MSKPKFNRVIGLLVSMGGLLFPTLVYAMPEDEPLSDLSDLTGNGMDDLGPYLVNVVVALVIIIGLILILVRFLSKKNSFFANRSINILGGVQLGQHKSLRMLQIGNSIYIVGVGENISLLDKIDDEDEKEFILSTLENEQSGFSSKPLALFKGLWKKDETNPYHEEEEKSFQEIFHQKMKRASKGKPEELFQQDEDRRTDR